MFDNGLLTKMILLALLPFRLNQEECERALLPTLEHASMVHSHIHHLTEDPDEAFAQTRNAIVYISVRVGCHFLALRLKLIFPFNAAGRGGIRDSGALARLSQLSIFAFVVGSDWETEHLWTNGRASATFTGRRGIRITHRRPRQRRRRQEKQSEMYDRAGSRRRRRLCLKRSAYQCLSIWIFLSSQKTKTQQRNILLKPQVVKFIFILYVELQALLPPDWLACALRRRKTRLVVGAQSHNQLFCGRQKSWHLTLGLTLV